MDPFIGEIRLLPYTFTPQDWFPCDGSLQQIRDYAALYSILGTAFGGDGKTTFGLPDLRNQAVVGANLSGSKPLGVTSYERNQKVGQASVTLTTTNTPSHNHTLQGAIVAAASLAGLSTDARLSRPANLANPTVAELSNAYVSPASPSTQVQLNPASLSDFPGEGKAHDNHQPYVVLRYCIAWNGDYPVNPN